ncbi:MAG: hypothetical protein NT067_02285 [Candidatus Diapherotrites archaeon]|nr:hypothetical protein [Candidatus Diapherotrites archaeon]
MNQRTIDVIAVLYLFAVLGAVALNLDKFNGLTKAYPLPMGFLKFAALATFGEFVKIRKATRKWNFKDWPFKLFVWGMFGMWFVIIFALFSSGVSAVTSRGLWPNFLAGNPAVDDSLLSFGRIFAAFSTSLWMNILALFAWPMMLVHEYFNKVIEKKKFVSTVEFGEGLDKKVWFRDIPFTVLWFWLPAHTITFCLPEEYRILMAALLSLALGFLVTTRKK